MNQPTPTQPTNPTPYLLRALYEWIGDNNDLPQILVDQTVAGVDVPPHLRGKNTMLYSIDMTACPDIQLGLDAISGSMRFGGRSYRVCFPIDSIIYIQGRQLRPIMLFRPMPLDANRAPTAAVEPPAEADASAPTAAPTPAVQTDEGAPTDGKKRPSFLTVVK